ELARGRDAGRERSRRQLHHDSRGGRAPAFADGDGPSRGPAQQRASSIGEGGGSRAQGGRTRRAGRGSAGPAGGASGRAGQPGYARSPRARRPARRPFALTARAWYMRLERRPTWSSWRCASIWGARGRCACRGRTSWRSMPNSRPWPNAWPSSTRTSARVWPSSRRSCFETNPEVTMRSTLALWFLIGCAAESPRPVGPLLAGPAPHPAPTVSDSPRAEPASAEGDVRDQPVRTEPWDPEVF